MRILRHIVTSADDGRAVRVVVPRRFALGTHAFRQLKIANGIYVNGENAHASRVLRTGDVIELHIATEEAQPAAPRDLPSPAPPSFIRYIDEDMIVVSKGAPLPTLPDAHSAGVTLREQTAALLGLNAQSFAYHPVNRLDKGTSGLLVLARHGHAQRLLTAQLHTGSFIREYLAVTEGIPQPPEGVVDAPIHRPDPASARRVVSKEGRRSVTHYQTEQTNGSRALIRLRLETGRTHQIRVHMAHISCPLVGDYLYGSPDAALPGRFALHSAFLSVRQPITGEIISLTEPLPSQLAALI